VIISQLMTAGGNGKGGGKSSRKYLQFLENLKHLLKNLVAIALSQLSRAVETRVLVKKTFAF
jgi:replicative DNA helicase